MTENLVCYMQQISKVKDTAAPNQKSCQSCNCCKGDTVCCSLHREVVLRLILMAAILLISLPVCMCLLGARMQVFCENMTGMMCD